MSIFDVTNKHETVKLRVEDELLLCCARTDVNSEIKDKIVSLIQNDLDWDYLLKLAFRHRLMPLLYHNLNSICPEIVPEDILGELKDKFNVNVRKNLMMTGELIKILNLLESEGILAISYKGSVLASLAYNNIAFRQFSDIDILINKSDAINIKDIMLSHGYRIYPHIAIDDSIYIELESEYRFISKDMCNIDINWDFKGLLFSFPVNPRFLFNDLKNVDINGFKIHTFSPVNQLLALCIHSAKHDWNRLSWICDISEFVKSYKDIDWNDTLKKAEILGIKRILFINLFLARDLFGLELPDNILCYLDLDPFVRTISYQIKEMLLKRNKSVNIFEKLFLDLKRRDKKVYGIKDCVNSLTKPSYKDFKDIPLPKLLFPLYYLIRPILLLKRYKNNSI